MALGSSTFKSYGKSCGVVRAFRFGKTFERNSPFASCAMQGKPQRVGQPRFLD
jgi:hypothetical protein